MSVTLLLSMLFTFSIATSCGAPNIESPKEGKIPSHEKWTALLQKYVDKKGLVNYKGFKNDTAKLQAYLKELEENPPADNWNNDEKLAYWINAYNAYTVALVVEHYPVKSIKDIKRGIPFVNTVWDIKFIKIAGKELDLNNIEHGIIRKEFNEPRIHFALVCAAQSCPRLRNEAYTPEKLDAQLDDEARYFINASGKNKIVSPNKATLSKLLDWYSGDFSASGGVIACVNKYSDGVKLSEDATLEYFEYDWSLNEQ